MLDKKTLLNRQGLLPFLVLAGLGTTWVYLQHETYLKSFLEDRGSLAFGAKIEIGTLHSKPFQGKVTLTNVQITNPSKPLFNLFTLGKVDVDFSFRELLKRKLVIKSLEINNIAADTQRKYSGVLELPEESTEVKPVLWERTDAGVFIKLRNQIKDGDFKNLSQITSGAYTIGKLPDLRKTLVSLKYLEDLNRDFNKATRTWKQQASLGPTTTQLNDWRKEISRWNQSERSIASADETERRAQLATTVREKYELLHAQLLAAGKELKEFKSKMEELNEILPQDIDAVKKALFLPSTDNKDYSVSLYGLHIISALEKLAFWSKSYRNYGQTISKAKGVESVLVQSPKGILIHFLDKVSYPSFYIQKGVFSSGSEANAEQNYVSGRFDDFLLFSRFYKKDFNLKIDSNFPETKLAGFHFSLSTTQIDEEPLEKFHLKIDSFPLEDTVVRRTPDFEIKITNGLGQIEAEGQFQGPKLTAKGRFEAIASKFQVSSQFQPFEEMLDSLTKYRTSLSVTGTAQAQADDLSLNLESDLGQKLAGSIKETFNQQLAQIDESLRANLLDSLFPLRQTFNELVQDTENVSMAHMRSSLNDLEGLIDYTKKYERKSKQVSRPQAG